MRSKELSVEFSNPRVKRHKYIDTSNCIYYGSPLVAAKAAAILPGVYYGSPSVPA
jgi:hypothetical protein